MKGLVDTLIIMGRCTLGSFWEGKGMELGAINSQMEIDMRDNTSIM